VLDLLLVPSIDFSMARAVAGFAGMITLLYGFIFELD
jgi:hypothetical protein